MLKWTREAAELFMTAAEKTEFYPKTAAILAKKLAGARTVCDAGCGIGTLSLELAAYFESVTAADKDPQAMAFLRRTLIEKEIRNVVCREEDLIRAEPEEQYDAMVFCYFGRTSEILHIAKRQCRGTVCIIKKDYRFHRFSPGLPVSDETTDDCTAILARLGIPFEREDCEFECGQPLRSAAEAVRFFALYDRSGAEMTETEAEQRLERTDDPVFPLYLPMKKKVGMFFLRTEDLP